jgi:hypothetical protein
MKKLSKKWEDKFFDLDMVVDRIDIYISKSEKNNIAFEEYIKIIDEIKQYIAELEDERITHLEIIKTYVKED